MHQYQKDICIKTLKILKENISAQEKIRDLGVYFIEDIVLFTPVIECLTGIVAPAAADIPPIKDDIEWWLFDNVKKEISFTDSTLVVDVETPEDFINWLSEWYAAPDKNA